MTYDASTLFTLNSNVMHVASFCFAMFFAAIAIGLNIFRRSANPLNGTTIFLDLLRGASIFPLMLFSVYALLPEMGKMAMAGEPLLVSLGAANGLFAICSDWWRNI
jgi:hypothetical protein